MRITTYTRKIKRLLSRDELNTLMLNGKLLIILEQGDMEKRRKIKRPTKAYGKPKERK